MASLPSYTLKITSRIGRSNLSIIIRHSLNAGITSFYLPEKDPIFPWALLELSRYPRERIFLISSGEDRSFRIETTPLRYYDLYLLSPSKDIATRWQEERKSLSLGLIDFTPQQLIRFTREGIGEPSVCCIQGYNHEMIRLCKTLGVQYVAIIPIGKEERKDISSYIFI